MGIEISNVEGGDEGIKFQIKEGAAASGVLDVVVNVGDEEVIVASDHFQNHEGGV
jgi:hypothetical protein